MMSTHQHKSITSYSVCVTEYTVNSIPPVITDGVPKLPLVEGDSESPEKIPEFGENDAPPFQHTNVHGKVHFLKE